MFCVIQKIELKKPNTCGEHKYLEAYSPFEINGRLKYSYRYSDERFERPIMTAYKISIHHSYRENGKVKKQQVNICTISYYGLIDYGIYDYVYDSRMEDIARSLNTDSDTIWQLINLKIDPLQEKIQQEFQQTEEYKAKVEHEKILKKYRDAKSKFATAYNVTQDTYDFCYDVFGKVMNQAYIKEIIDNFKANQEYQKKQHSYYEKSSSNYKSSSYSNYLGSNYNEDEKAMLKKFYKLLSVKFHPDMNHDADTTKEMQMIVKLKEQWGL